ncbi:TRAP transporter small permease subunit [Modicisalibacter zincidurans]|uniref:TRAP transporter small permease protein n=1 Tax=Modicisalibacter zincidurans TaxID=1178777 RepID=A0ABP9RFN3_9GAMM|nr:TRAP transporter small permease [Halomonas zincidurans]
MLTQKFQLAAHKLAHGAAIAAGYAALGLSLLIAFEVIARKFFNFSLQGVDEIGGYVLAIGVAFSFAYALLHRAHTRVDMLLVKLPVPLRAFLNTLAMLLLAAFAAFMLWRAVETLRETLEFGSRASTPLQTPLWIPQTLWGLGLGVFALLAVLLALRALSLLLHGCFASINGEFDPRSADDELDEARQDYGASVPESQQRRSPS